MSNFAAQGNFDPGLPIAATALAIVGLASIPSVISIITQTRQNAPKDNFYEDEDGKSTPEAVADFSNKKAKTAISIASVITFGTSLAIAILTTLSENLEPLMPAWLIAAAFGVILLQDTLVIAQRSSVKAHDLGLWAFLSTVIVSIVTILQLRDFLRQNVHRDDPVLILRAVNLLSSVALAFSNISLQRRPDVFFRGEKVDRQFTVSVISRYTWTYVYPLISYATKNGDLDEKDVPQPDHLLQVDYLLKAWHDYKFTSTLAWSLFRAYKGRLFVQWAVIFVRCLFGIGPFYVMLRLINTLDYKTPGEWPSYEMWGYVFWMGFFSLGEMWLDGWIAFQSITMVSLPMRAQLSALVFEKSLKRKTVKSAEKPEELKPEENEGTEEPASEGADKTKKDDEKKPDDDDSVLKSRQAIVNLVGVDVRRISNFFAFSFHILLSFGKLAVYSTFLVNLIGWIPFGAGMFAWGLSLPVNTLFSKLYMKASDDLMKLRDKKLAVVNEALLGMRQIKFAALENQWQKRIMGWRDKELKGLWNVFRYDIVLIGCWITSPILLAATSLATYAYINGNLSASVAFVSIGIFKALEVTLGALPELLTSGLDTLVSIRRVEKYLGGPEIKKIVREGPDVAFENASLAWPVDEEVLDEDRFVLRNVNLSFPAGELSVISGKTGTGKSLLLSGILGEVDLLEGNIYAPPTLPPLERHDGKAHPGNWILPGSIAYVSQTPWLESASLRDNILFGLPFIEERYNTVIDVCALKKDLAILTDGDKTELGANGINLSGGQKWRITLARAIYSRAEILVMDDIFSAVDAHVGRQIFDKCIGGEICRKRTRILVTHHVGLVQSQAKYIVELGEGTVTHAGLVSELAEDGTLEQIKSHEQQVEIQEVIGESSTAVNSEDASINEGEAETALQKVQSKDAKKFIEEEKREKGMVKTRVYKVYFREAGGIFAWGVCLICFFASEAGDLGRSWWLKIWTGEQGTSAHSMSVNAFSHQGYRQAYTMHQSWNSTQDFMFNTADNSRGLGFYLWAYVAISLASALIGVFRFWWTLQMSLKASRTLFEQITFAVLRTPLRWLDTVPVGRILNRMTSDFEIIDQRVAMGMGMMMWNALAMLGVCVAGALVSGYILPLALGLMAIAVMIGKKYMDGARPLKRLESNAKSPVFELFNAALAGMPTLRAYQKTQVYVERMHQKFDTWDSISAYIWVMNRWLGIRMAVLSAAFTILMGAIVIVSPGIGSALGGFALSFAVDFALNMIFAIRLYSQLELDMNGTERVVEYTELKIETQEGQEPPAAWPTSGRLEVEDLVVAYADDLQPVLRGISFDVKDNERIGVVGRTGAGKSSLTLALFRFLEPRSGKVMIDGLDISKIDLHSLRSRLAIIPQDPVLFSGTVRSNLDPFDDHSDEALKECLARVHLLDSVAPTPVNEPSSAAGSAAASTAAPKNANIFKDLSSPIAESGGNLSQGQRQLLCLARAIISRPKIMVLDEATSAVDMSTDALIQRSIREEFTSSTLLVIAHRLSTIADFDRILVLNEGQVAEFGSPKELWEKEGGIFRDMCESSGEKEKLRATIFG